jgi:hypothetical protein
MLCRSGERFQTENLKDLFVQKCRARQIQPDVAGLVSENLKEWNKGAWENILRPLMKFGKNGLPYYQKLFKNSELKWLHLPTFKLEATNNFSIEELDRA